MENPAGDLFKGGCAVCTRNDERKGDALYLIIAASGRLEHYHKQVSRSRLKSSGGAHASVSAAAIFYLLSAVVNADKVRKRHVQRRGDLLQLVRFCRPLLLILAKMQVLRYNQDS